MKRLPALLMVLSALWPLAAQPKENPRGEVITELAPAAKKRLIASCFEVVVPKPEKDSLTYEKPLPWDLLPFNLRNDKYFSIGTAFAVSATELVTAFHVLDLHQVEKAYPRYFIRDAEGKVFEVDQIVQAHEHRDAVKFTVKGRTFSQWLELTPTFELDRPVFTAGNAYGEGIVVRRGELIGTLPEEMDGAWNWLKTSADVNSGNSGGPLLDPAGRVIGIVVRRKDNLSYALPVAEFQKLKTGQATYYTKIGYSFSLLPDQSRPNTSAFELPLPMGYRELKEQAMRKRHESYAPDMEALFAQQKDVFPAGKGSLPVIYDVPTSGFPELVFKTNNDDRWGITDVEPKWQTLEGNGSLGLASEADILLLKLIRPETLSLEDLIAKPRLAMDLIFKAINVPRELAGQKTRITSLGEPYELQSHTDRYGRTWSIGLWHMEFSDKVVFLASTPTPQGLCMLLKETASTQVMAWSWDLRRVLDFTYVPYTGRLQDWGPFLALGPKLPEALRAIRLTYAAGKRLTLTSPWLRMDLDTTVQPLEPKDTLGLYFGFNGPAASAPWELRRAVVASDESDDYFVWIRHLKPVPDMDEGWIKGWKEKLKQRHPYTQQPFSEEGRTNIAQILESFQAPTEKAEVLYTLYVGRTGTVPDKEMKALLKATAKALAPGS